MTDVQKRILEIFTEIKQLCEENGIRYYAIGGTAIGAIRHNGFIPWDDDLDIAIPSDDMPKFLELVTTELTEHLALFDPEDTKVSFRHFYKIHDIRTTFIEPTTIGDVNARYGVFVDIMPMYGIPDSPDMLKAYIREIRFLRLMDRYRRRTFSNCGTIKQKACWLFLKPINYFLPTKYWCNALKKYQKKWGFDSSKKVGYTWSNRLSEKLVFDRELFQDYQEIPFETTTIRCPKGYHKYLTQQFGDYLSLPPEDQRISGHFPVVIDLENSYRCYDLSGRLIDEHEK